MVYFSPAVLLKLMKDPGYMYDLQKAGANVVKGTPCPDSFTLTEKEENKGRPQDPNIYTFSTQYGRIVYLIDDTDGDIFILAEYEAKGEYGDMIAGDTLPALNDVEFTDLIATTAILERLHKDPAPNQPRTPRRNPITEARATRRHKRPPKT